MQKLNKLETVSVYLNFRMFLVFFVHFDIDFIINFEFQYTYSITTGNWQHRTFWNKHQMISLKDIGYTDKGMDKGRVKSPRYMNQERYKLVYKLLVILEMVFSY